MKLRYLYLTIGVLYSILLMSCGDISKERIEIIPCEAFKDALTFNVSPTEVQTIDITSEANWKVVVDQGSGNWLTVSPLEGVGNGTITISANKNNGPKRGATLTLAAKGAEIRTITIIQDGYKGTMYNYGDFAGLQKAGLVAGVEPISIVDNAECEDGKALKIFTRPGVAYEGTNGDRFKVQTTTRFGSGRYEWRVYVPKFGMNDRASIGAFLYFDDRHELDFEICSGKATDRAANGAGPDDMLCLVSSQANPFFSEFTPIKGNAWHTFVIDLKLENKKYLAEWLVDGKTLKRAQLNFGEEAYFHAISSVENLYGMGDHAATQENYALFDYLEYVPYEYSMKPIIEGQLPPEPEGITTRWSFDEDGVIPTGWVNNKGSVSGGTLNLPNGSNIKYGEAVGAGKYTWEIDVPSVGVGEKWLAGGNIAATNAEERTF
ncbi:MAG: BACON domain-containing protein, partial [Bacteroides sp.]